jgi:hypothetical protein
MILNFAIFGAHVQMGEEGGNGAEEVVLQVAALPIFYHQGHALHTASELCRIQ